MMVELYRLQNPVQNYDWGSYDAIPRLLGQPVPSPDPQAELWMGAHPKGPSQALVAGHWTLLPELIAASPESILGSAVAADFEDKLPFLFKVLSASRALSIQVHPSIEQARAGFARENRLGIPVTAPERNYRDENHKPEIICALTPFYALNGFRNLPEMLDLLQRVDSQALRPHVDAFNLQPDAKGLERFFTAIMTMDIARQRQAVTEVVHFTDIHQDEGMVFEWIVELNAQYPGDIGVLSPLLINLVRLEPGQAMYSQARQLHAYLLGTGIELMANSDNVLRGGLTSKHIDVPELLATLRYDEADIVIQQPQPAADGSLAFSSNAREFHLSIIDVGPVRSFESVANRSVEILICTEGEVRVFNTASGQSLDIRQGESFLAPASVPVYRVEGMGRLFRASVPD
ncbi:MAG: mannose-6-phosphate isomerase, class I [Caldilineales bacterium]|nr:mannose-6-phosphate isomerase, class I [Caldilineales bacterium]